MPPSPHPPSEEMEISEFAFFMLSILQNYAYNVNNNRLFVIDIFFVTNRDKNKGG